MTFIAATASSPLSGLVPNPMLGNEFPSLSW